MKMTALLSLLMLASLCAGQAPRESARQGAAGRTALAEAASSGEVASSRGIVAPPGEPGDALLVSGVVYGADGRTPLAGATVYVYQTDARGYYGANNSNDSRNPRLRATMRTDAEGRYEFRTIRPGSYPGTQNPAHIHYVVNAPGHAEKVFEIVFDDDPLVGERIRAMAEREGSIFSIRKLERDERGLLRTTQDIVMRRS
jgi:protocatechuate 3,4-dioxygenase beta subunit